MAVTDNEAGKAYKSLCGDMRKRRVIDRQVYPGSSIGIALDLMLAPVYLDFSRNLADENVSFLIRAGRDCFQSSLLFDLWEDPDFTLSEWQKDFYYQTYFKEGARFWLNVSEKIQAEAEELMGPSGSRSEQATNRRLGNFFKVCVRDISRVLDTAGSVSSWLTRFYLSQQFKSYQKSRPVRNNPHVKIRFGKEVSLHGCWHWNRKRLVVRDDL